MQNRYLYAIVAGSLCLSVFVTGCLASPAGLAEASSLSDPAPAAAPDMAAAPQPVAAKSEVPGTGSIRYETADGEILGADQEALLLSYMHLYYRSLAQLEVGDPGPLFTPDAQGQALARRGVWETVIAVRRAQSADLSLTGFSYELTCTGLSEDDDGVTVSMRENAVQRFAAYPGVDSESFGIIHRFALSETAEDWRLRSHMQMDAANLLAAGRLLRASSADGTAEVQTYLDTRRAEILAAHSRGLADRARQTAAHTPGAAPGYTWDHDYDRAAAVDYAAQWVGGRNSGVWPSYDRNGGNCANYTSQCLLAGGIPMDYSGTRQWKWYGDTPNTAQAPSGRSGAWSSVTEFYAYARDNTGYGLVAEVDAQFWSGEPGDLVQLGYEDNWRHVVIIADVIRDADGNAVDYLIHSNTADLRRYPLSAYLYPQQRLIRIHGWNGGGQV